VAALFKAWVCGRPLAGIVGSNPAGGHGCLSLLSVVCCQVKVCATGWSLVQRGPTECVCVCVCVCMCVYVCPVSVIRCNNNCLLYLQLVSKAGQTKRERKKETSWLLILYKLHLTLQWYFQALRQPIVGCRQRLNRLINVKYFSYKNDRP